MFFEYIVPAVIIVICNVFHGDPNQKSYEIVTACFGWSIVPSMILYLFTQNDIAFQISMFCMIAALSRDYEKMLKAIFRKT